MIALILMAAFAAPQPTELKLFQDWAVGCDNGRACQAVALMPESWPEQARTMSVRRGAGAEAALQIWIDVDLPAGARLAADGKPLAASLVESESGASVAPEATKALVAALRSASRLEVRGADGAVAATISLAGASAALLFMDAQQRRVGTVTALVRPGRAPASAVPPPPALPQVVAPRPPAAAAMAITPARVAALRKESGCEIDEVGGPDSSETARLDASRTLVLLSCGSGAYNVTAIPFIAQGTGGAVRIEIALFDVQPGWWEDGRPTLINAGWDKERGLLTAFSKGRGLGDCGTDSEYAWDGRRFRLVKQAEMDECRGSVDYITTWRAQVVHR